jgi:site-specific recombinase XerD
MQELIKPSNDLPSLTLLDFVSSNSELSRINEISRIQQFELWIQKSHKHLLTVNLIDYRTHLLQKAPPLRPSSINAHLKTIRGRYRKMFQSDAYRNALIALAQEYSLQHTSSTIGDVIAIANELDKRIHNRIFSDDVFVKEVTRQDVADEESGIRLSPQNIIELLRSPDIQTPHGIRDAALLALMVCTGLREHEAVAVDVDDLRMHFQGVLCLRIRMGKGAKQRVIPYGSLKWCLDYVDRWLQMAKISSGPVFRGFWGDSKSVRPTRITVRQVHRIVGAYPITIEGSIRRIKPHDLRRTYARLQFESGMKPEALQQNMGHTSYDTTMGYIGVLDAEKRMSKVNLEIPHQPE